MTDRVIQLRDNTPRNLAEQLLARIGNVKVIIMQVQWIDADGDVSWSMDWSRCTCGDLAYAIAAMQKKLLDELEEVPGGFADSPTDAEREHAGSGDSEQNDRVVSFGDRSTPRLHIDETRSEHFDGNYDPTS